MERIAWTCPKCNVSHAPWVDHCDCSNSSKPTSEIQQIKETLEEIKILMESINNRLTWYQFPIYIYPQYTYPVYSSSYPDNTSIYMSNSDMVNTPSFMEAAVAEEIQIGGFTYINYSIPSV